MKVYPLNNKKATPGRHRRLNINDCGLETKALGRTSYRTHRLVYTARY